MLKMLQKLQEYKWYLIIGISVLIILMLMYQSYSTNKQVNMLYRCLNELSYRIDEVADSIVSIKSSSSLVKQGSQSQQVKQVHKKPLQRPIKQNTLPPTSPNKKVNTVETHKQQSSPLVSETIIFQVSPSQPSPSRMTASTIEEIDSDVDIEEEMQMKDVDLDKVLEAELSELND